MGLLGGGAIVGEGEADVCAGVDGVGVTGDAVAVAVEVGFIVGCAVAVLVGDAEAAACTDTEVSAVELQ